jgi:hypothetical protein
LGPDFTRQRQRSSIGRGIDYKKVRLSPSEINIDPRVSLSSKVFDLIQIATIFAGANIPLAEPSPTPAPEFARSAV